MAKGPDIYFDYNEDPATTTVVVGRESVSVRIIPQLDPYDPNFLIFREEQAGRSWFITGRDENYYNHLLPPEYQVPNGPALRRDDTRVLEIATGLGPLPLALRKSNATSIFIDPAPYESIARVISAVSVVAARDFNALLPHDLGQREADSIRAEVLARLKVFQDRCGYAQSLIGRPTGNQLFINSTYEQALQTHPRALTDVNLLACIFGHSYWRPDLSIERHFESVMARGGIIVTEKGKVKVAK
jgi:hypothetical protein